jgi:pyroglutamyl-peptidase
MDPPSPDQMQIVLDVDHPNGFPSNEPQHIHITALQIPPTYDAAFECVTALHARPPVIPPSNPPSVKVAPAPENGYDFIFHVGVAGRGPFRIERVGHKSGYRMKDSSNKYAPVIEFLPEVNALEPSQAEILNQMRISSANLAIMGPVGPVDTSLDHPVRGFGKGYESFAEDLHTMIDVEHLVYSMKEQGVEVCISSSLVLLRLIHEHDARFIRQWMLDIA